MRDIGELRAEILGSQVFRDPETLRNQLADAELMDHPVASAIAALISARLADVRHDNAEVIDKALRAKDLARVAGDVELEIRANQLAANAYQAGGEFALALETSDESLHLNQAIGDRLIEGSIHATIGLTYRESGDYPSAIDHFERALTIFKGLDNKALLANITCNIGGTYFYLGRNEDAVTWLEQGIAMQYEVGNRPYAIAQASGLSKVLYDVGRIDDSETLLRRVHAEALELGDPEVLGATTLDMGRLLLLQGQLEESIAFLKQHADLLEKTWARSIDKDTLIGVAESNLGRHEESIVILEAALERATSIGSKAHMQNINRILKEVAKELGDLERYIRHNDEEQRLLDELRGASAVRKLAMMESEKKITALNQEREKERAVLYSTLPQHIADRMIRGETVNDFYESAAVLFADIVGFTSHTSEMDAHEVSALLEGLYRRFDDICRRHNVIKVKTIGDSYLCFKGDDTAEANANAIAAVAREMVNVEISWPSGEPLTIRIGIHLGPVSAGVIGTERLQYDIWGDTVNVASRMESTGEAGRIHVSSTLHTLLSDLRERGTVEVKGKGTMATYWLEGA